MDSELVVAEDRDFHNLRFPAVLQADREPKIMFGGD